MNQQLNIHTNITHARKQIGLTWQTRRNRHYRGVNRTRTSPKSDYYALFMRSVRIQERLRLSVCLSVCLSLLQLVANGIELQNTFRLSLVLGTYIRCRQDEFDFWPRWSHTPLNSLTAHNELVSSIKKPPLV
jgi:hypothetical protein